MKYKVIEKIDDSFEPEVREETYDTLDEAIAHLTLSHTMICKFIEDNEADDEVVNKLHIDGNNSTYYMDDQFSMDRMIMETSIEEIKEK